MLELGIVLALIALNGFFAMSEMALVTSRKSRLKQMAEEHASDKHASDKHDPAQRGPTRRGAAVALALAEHPDNLLSTVQVGITAIGILTGLLGGEAIGLLIAGWLQGLWPGAIEYTRPIGIGTAFVLITSSTVIFGELVPKRLALTNPEAIASVVAIPLHALSRLARPVVATLGVINRGVLRLFGIRDDARAAISEEEIRLLVSESHEQGVIDADERKMVYRVLSLGDRTAESLMTPRPRITWLDAEAPVAESLERMRETPFSRYPVYRGDDREVLGILEAKSLLDALEEPGVPDMFGRLREALFVSESTHAFKLLEIFREEQQSIALVVDEYGDVTGLVTVNDLLGAVIGRLQSAESEDGEAPVVQRADGSWLIDGSLSLDDLRELIDGTRLPIEDEPDFHTAAGMVISHFGRIPHVGEYLAWDRWRIEVVDLDGPRIDKLLLQPLPDLDVEDDDLSV